MTYFFIGSLVSSKKTGISSTIEKVILQLQHINLVELVESSNSCLHEGQTTISLIFTYFFALKYAFKYLVGFSLKSLTIVRISINKLSILLYAESSFNNFAKVPSPLSAFSKMS